MCSYFVKTFPTRSFIPFFMFQRPLHSALLSREAWVLVHIFIIFIYEIHANAKTSHRHRHPYLPYCSTWKYSNIFELDLSFPSHVLITISCFTSTTSEAPSPPSCWQLQLAQLDDDNNNGKNRDASTWNLPDGWAQSKK